MPLIFRGVVQLASMLAWGASGRRFESCHSDTARRSSESFGTKSGFFYSHNLMSMSLLKRRDGPE